MYFRIVGEKIMKRRCRDMENNNGLFSKPKKNKKVNPKFKYLALSFSLFIIILAVFSAFLFMRSIDFDFNNIVDRTTAEEPSDTVSEISQSYSVSELTGKTVYLFMITNDSSVADFGFIITADFDSKNITVKSFDAGKKLADGKSFADIYEGGLIDELKQRINSDFSISVNKYIVCTPTQLKKIIASFGGITVNVTQAVNYKSPEFNVILDKGEQKLSDEFVYKYLAVSSDTERSRIMCDILNGALTPENSEKSEVLFKNFVNNCKTDISVIDFSNASEKIKIYSNAEDKFYPTAIG